VVGLRWWQKHLRVEVFHRFAPSFEIKAFIEAKVSFVVYFIIVLYDWIGLFELWRMTAREEG